MTTWGNDAEELQFRRRGAVARDAGGDAWARLWVGLGALLALALVYPVYEYNVHAALIERDLRVAAKQLDVETRAAVDAIEHESQRQLAETRRLSHAERLAAVRVMGVSDSGGAPVVMVELRGLTAAQAAVPICAQARQWLKRSLEGEPIRVQAARGDRPAQNAGRIRCN